MKASCQTAVVRSGRDADYHVGKSDRKRAGGIGPEPGGEISVTLHYRHGWLPAKLTMMDRGSHPTKSITFLQRCLDKRKRARRRFSTCQTTVENLGGSIAVESEPGIFTQFLSRYPGTGRGRTDDQCINYDDDAMVAELNRRYVAQIPGFNAVERLRRWRKPKRLSSIANAYRPDIARYLYAKRERARFLPVLHNARCKSDVIVISSAAMRQPLKIRCITVSWIT